MKRNIAVLMLICLALTLCACGGQGAKPAAKVENSDQSAFTWGIELRKSEVKEKLHTDEGVQQYDGGVLNVLHDDAPSEGKVFLILTMTITKQKTGGGQFDWARLTVKDASGNVYHRMENDAFLSNHTYNRMPGTSLQIGENRGSICLELPPEAAKGGLTLCYDAGDEGENTTAIVL